VESWFKYGLRLPEETQCAQNLTLRCINETVVVVDSQYVLNILSVCLYTLLSSTQSTCTVLHFYFWHVSLALSFTFFINCTFIKNI